MVPAHENPETGHLDTGSRTAGAPDFISLQATSITFYVIFLCVLKNRKWAAIKSIQQSIQEPRWLQSNTTFLHLVQLLKNTE